MYCMAQQVSIARLKKRDRKRYPELEKTMIYRITVKSPGSSFAVEPPECRIFCLSVDHLKKHVVLFFTICFFWFSHFCLHLCQCSFSDMFSYVLPYLHENIHIHGRTQTFMWCGVEEGGGRWAGGGGGKRGKRGKREERKRGGPSTPTTPHTNTSST